MKRIFLLLSLVLLLLPTISKAVVKYQDMESINGGNKGVGIGLTYDVINMLSQYTMLYIFYPFLMIVIVTFIIFVLKKRKQKEGQEGIENKNIKTSKLATVSLLFVFATFTGFGSILLLPGIIMGFFALYQTKKDGDTVGFKIAMLAVGGGSILFIMLLFIFRGL